MEKYEVLPVWFKGMQHETIIGILTGLQLEEIKVVCPKRDIWYTKDYLTIFQTLGFNTNQRFKKFNPDTEYPCIMRCNIVGEINGYWYGWVYNDYKVYDTRGQVWPFDEWVEAHCKEYRITSMLQVWI